MFRSIDYSSILQTKCWTNVRQSSNLPMAPVNVICRKSVIYQQGTCPVRIVSLLTDRRMELPCGTISRFTQVFISTYFRAHFILLHGLYPLNSTNYTALKSMGQKCWSCNYSRLANLLPTTRKNGDSGMGFGGYNLNDTSEKNL